MIWIWHVEWRVEVRGGRDGWDYYKQQAKLYQQIFFWPVDKKLKEVEASQAVFPALPLLPTQLQHIVFKCFMMFLIVLIENILWDINVTLIKGLSLAAGKSSEFLLSVFVHVRLKVGANTLCFLFPPKYHSTTAARSTSDLRSDVSNRVENHTKKKKNSICLELSDLWAFTW